MVVKTTLGTRIKDAINAFRGKPIRSINYGLSIKRCDECEFKNNNLRDDLLVTSGARAAYMHEIGDIKLPDGVEGEGELAVFISRVVDCYLLTNSDRNFDEYIEVALRDKYALKKGE